MKKVILTATLFSTMIMCKKTESTGTNADVYSETDSLQNTEMTADSSMAAPQTMPDSASIRVKNFDPEKISASVSKSIDSLAEKIENTKLVTEKKISDSSAKKSEKIVINVPPPKIVRETKVIYKNAVQKEIKNDTPKVVKMTKKGSVEMRVTNTDTAKQIIIDEIEKHDGILRSENISHTEHDQNYAFLKVKVPIGEFESFMDNIKEIGEPLTFTSETSGDDYQRNNLCEVEITLYEKQDTASAGANSGNFGGKSFAAISSGWNVITSIFLFLLPLWPLFLIGGGIYYYFKKKQTKNTAD